MTERELNEIIRDNEVRCGGCGGSGECVTSHRWTCPDCGGSGKVLPPGMRKLADAVRARLEQEDANAGPR